MKILIALAVLAGLSSCSSPPKPPSADESRRHPLNAAAEVGWQACKGELQNARILVSERSRDAERLRASLTAPAAARPANTGTLDDTRGLTYTVLFPFGAAAVELKSVEAETIFSQAKAAPLIVVSGRTDGTVESAAESRIARQRAEFIRNALLRAGIPAARIRTTWQSVGDHVADNTSPAGRALNRRVEIELYRAAPRLVRLDRTSAS